MTKPDIEQVLDHWLGDGRDILPDRSVEAVLRTIERTSQRSASRVPWRIRTVDRNPPRSMMAGAAVIVVIAVGGLLWLSGSGAPSIGAPTPSAGPTGTADQATGPDPSAGLVPDVVVGHWVASRDPYGLPGRYELVVEPNAVSVRRIDGTEAPAMVGGAGKGTLWDNIEFKPTSTCEGSAWYRWFIEVDGPAVRALVLIPMMEDCEVRRSFLVGRWPAADSQDIPGLFPDEWGESLEGGRHALTVDGIALSFRVPAQVPDAGWARYGNLYISKGSTGGQAAEAVIYWTAFPDGALADPCGLLSQPVGPSIDDLASLVSKAPHTKLVAGPADVTVGERPAKHVVLTVGDDVGCDPGFFYTWLYQPGGPGWWSTSAGDTINVWIVDVGGRRLVIVGESTWDAGPELEREIPQIVDSIRFDSP
jgi:hypothetical protein